MHKQKQTAWTRGAMLGVSFIALLSLTGCFDVDSQFKQVRETVLDGTGAHYEVEAEFAIGPVAIGLVRKILGWVDDENDPDIEMASSLLREIKGVQIGNYILSNFKFERDDVYCHTMEIVRYMEDHQYDSIVRNFEDDGASLIMVRTSSSDPDKIREVLVLDMSEHELSLVQLKGDVQEIIDIATRDKSIPGVDKAIEETSK